jgi:hypothetical protein
MSFPREWVHILGEMVTPVFKRRHPRLTSFVERLAGMTNSGASAYIAKPGFQKAANPQERPQRQTAPVSVTMHHRRRSVGPVCDPDQKHQDGRQAFHLGLLVRIEVPIGAGHDR